MSIIQEKIVNNGHGALSSSYFCVHSTANPGASAANHVSLWSRDYEYAVHLVSDWTEAYHTVPYDRLCYQVGNGNSLVEGLEICEAINQEDFMKGIQIAAQVVRERLAAHGWGVVRLITHNDASQRWGGSDHTDPLPYFARFNYTWQDFVNLVQDSTATISVNAASADVNNWKDNNMFMVETTTPWGTTAYALLGEVTGARALTDIEALGYAQGLTTHGKGNFDIYNMLISQAWQRHNDFLTAMGKEVTESVEEATQRIVDATKK